MPEKSRETSKHTPGPWGLVDFRGPYGYGPLKVVTMETDVDIANMIQDPDMMDEELEANARLIAAAPALYEACKEAVQDLQEYCDLSLGAMEALAKAVSLADGPEEKPQVRPIRKVGSDCRGHLSATYQQIVDVVGEPNVTDLDDPDKVAAGWGFTDGRREAFIWSYKHPDPASCERWSVSGSMELLKKLFPNMIA